MSAESPSEIMSKREHENVSARRLAEIESIYTHVPAGLCVVDSDLRFVRINDRLAEINGVSVAGHLGRTVREVLPDLAGELEPLFRTVLDTGEPILRREVRGTTPAQPKVERHWLASYCPLREGGNVAGVNVVVVEITEQKREQETLQRSEERLQIALEGNSEGVWDWDIRKGPAVFSPGYARMLGYEPEEFAKDYDAWRSLVHPDDIGEVDRAHAEHIYGGKKFRVELRMRRKTGGWCWILSRGAVVERDAEGNALRMIGTHMDITEQKLAEQERTRLQEQLQQAQKLESVGRLAGGIAHDFNNLLTVINGYSDLLLRELTPDDPHHEIITEIRKVGSRAAALTRQLLAFSRKQVLHPQPLIIDPVVRDMQHMISRLLGEDVELKLELNAGEAAVFHDPGQFDQVLMNLVVNARDAMPAGGTLTIATKSLDLAEPGQAEGEEHSLVVIEVADTGMGMNEEVRKHLFEPYFTTKERGKGSGLGLSTMHGIIAQSGGRIDVESAPGAGSAFRIYLPKLQKPFSIPRSVEGITRLTGTETVLVVEDELQVRSYTCAALRAYGYHVLAAGSVQDALLVFKRERVSIDLVLTDVVMPGLSGRDLAAKLAQLHPAIKVLYMSGYTSDIITSHGMLEEGLVLIEKPFSPEELAQKVREVLGPPKPLGLVLISADGELRSQLHETLNRAGYEVVETAQTGQKPEYGNANPVDLIVIELAMPEHEAIEAVRSVRDDAPGVPVIVILEASGGRFLELERLIAADRAIAKPISPEFLVKTVEEVLHAGGKRGDGFAE